jgi:hypothetical protein
MGEDEGRNKWCTLAFGALFMYVRVLQRRNSILNPSSHTLDSWTNELRPG